MNYWLTNRLEKETGIDSPKWQDTEEECLCFRSSTGNVFHIREDRRPGYDTESYIVANNDELTLESDWTAAENEARRVFNTGYVGIRSRHLDLDDD